MFTVPSDCLLWQGKTTLLAAAAAPVTCRQTIGRGTIRPPMTSWPAKQQKASLKKGMVSTPHPNPFCGMPIR